MHLNAAVFSTMQWITVFAIISLMEAAKTDVKDEKDRQKIKSMGYAKGGSASSRADGIATKGKTRGKMC